MEGRTHAGVVVVVDLARQPVHHQLPVRRRPVAARLGVGLFLSYRGAAFRSVRDKAHTHAHQRDTTIGGPPRHCKPKANASNSIIVPYLVVELCGGEERLGRLPHRHGAPGLAPVGWFVLMVWGYRDRAREFIITPRANHHGTRTGLRLRLRISQDDRHT